MFSKFPTTYSRVLAGGLLLSSVALLSGGCGGGTTLSGPDSSTSAGLGTLIVKAPNGNTVTIEGIGAPKFIIVRPTRNGKAFFYNLPPRRYQVEARDSSGGSDSKKVDIAANSTLTIYLSPTGGFATPFSSSPTPFGQ